MIARTEHQINKPRYLNKPVHRTSVSGYTLQIPGIDATSCFRSGSPGWISPQLHKQVSYSRAPHSGSARYVSPTVELSGHSVFHWARRGVQSTAPYRNSASSTSEPKGATPPRVVRPLGSAAGSLDPRCRRHLARSGSQRALWPRNPGSTGADHDASTPVLLLCGPTDSMRVPRKNKRSSRGVRPEKGEFHD